MSYEETRIQCMKLDNLPPSYTMKMKQIKMIDNTQN